MSIYGLTHEERRLNQLPLQCVHNAADLVKQLFLPHQVKTAVPVGWT